MSLSMEAGPGLVEFADGPIASHSARFGLGRPQGTQAKAHPPSPVGLRPWNLRTAQVVGGTQVRLGRWFYDPRLQVAVTEDGRLLVDVLAADPSAESVSHLDGDEGASEDWRHDFHPDHTSGDAA